MTNWKEKWNKYTNGEFVDPVSFIETEIIEKLIDEISGMLMYAHQENELKKQLKDKWLK